jgi:hypothetical protein
MTVILGDDMEQRNQGFRVEFDAKYKILRLTFQGRYTDEDLLAGYAILRSCYDRFGSCHCIVDYTGVSDVAVTITTNGVRQLANKQPIFPMDCVTVNIAPNKLMYGMARMFQILSSDTRTNFRVVNSMEEALDLIEVKSPNFLPVNLEEAA